MDSTTLAGLVLALSSATPTFPTAGTGFFEQILGNVNQVTWSLGGTLGSDVGSTGVGPGPCTSTCPFDFTVASVTLPFASQPGYIMVPTLSISGPRVIATAVCPGVPVCLPGSRLYQTVWGTAPISLTGLVRFVSTSNVNDVVEFMIAGHGTAVAENTVELSGNTLSTSRTRYQFTYEVVPEPRSVTLLAGGLLIAVVIVRRHRRTRGVSLSARRDGRSIRSF